MKRHELKNGIHITNESIVSGTDGEDYYN